MNGPAGAGPARTGGPQLLSSPPSEPEDDAPPTGSSPLEVRLLAIMAAARFHGSELDREDLRFPSGEAPAPAMLVEWVRQSGLWVRATRMRWRNLVGLQSAGPIVLLLTDG